MTTQQKYIVKSSWGEEGENKGTALWQAPSASEAGEKHRKAFPNEKISLISKCDEDHFESIFDALKSQT